MDNNHIREQFGAHAATYVGSPVHAKGASLNRLVTLLDPQPNWHVLDIATGAGHTALAFAPYVQTVHATDITPQMLAATHGLAVEHRLDNIFLAEAEAHDLPYAAGLFDLVTCRIAAHHFADPARFVSEAARVLKPGGWLAIVDNVVPPGSVGDYVNAFEKLRDPSHGRCLTLEEWAAAYTAAGLTVRQQETLAKRLNFAFWAQRHEAAMQAYLLALLYERSPAVQAFLDPHETSGDITFRLLEGLFVAQSGPGAGAIPTAGLDAR